MFSQQNIWMPRMRINIWRKSSLYTRIAPLIWDLACMPKEFRAFSGVANNNNSFYFANCQAGYLFGTMENGKFIKFLPEMIARTTNSILESGIFLIKPFAMFMVLLLWEHEWMLALLTSVGAETHFVLIVLFASDEWRSRVFLSIFFEVLSNWHHVSFCWRPISRAIDDSFERSSPFLWSASLTCLCLFANCVVSKIFLIDWFDLAIYCRTDSFRRTF